MNQYFNLFKHDLSRIPLLGLALVMSQSWLFGQSVAYTESSEIIANPERGLYKYTLATAEYATTPGFNNLSVNQLNNWKNSSDRFTLVYRYLLVDMFLNSDFNQTYLDNIQKDFENLRAAGLKAIVRVSYSNTISNTEPQQPAKDQILKHISQLKPIFLANKDVIFSHQAGYIGTWGEWYFINSPEFGNKGNINAEQWANRKEVIDSLLAILPLEIPLQVRYPRIKTTLYGNASLTEQTAYQNDPNARIGFFNDAFLNNYGDQGTYQVNGVECLNPVGTDPYNYVSNETRYLPMSGETNGLNPCDGGVRSTGANAVYEMGLTNWTSINRGYHPDFWNVIINDNRYDEILRRLGYRFVLNTSDIEMNGNGQGFRLRLDITNRGFARPFKKREVYLVLRNTTTDEVVTALINTDIRTWGNEVDISQDFEFALDGNFDLYLWMPDQDPKLQKKSDYSIRLANSDVWIVASGYNDLKQNVTLKSQPLSATENIAKEKLELYPNPNNTGIVFFNNTSKSLLKIEVFDVGGRRVIDFEIYQNKIDIRHLNAGVYFVRIYKHNFRSAITQKLMIE